MIVFTVPAVPVAQPRQRHRLITTNAGRTFAQNYTPTKAPVNVFKAAVQMALQAAYQGAPLEGPVALVAVFVLPRPKRLHWKKRAMPRVMHTGKPDLDNLEKGFEDALTGLAWGDDSQVAIKRTWKVYAAGDEQPHVEIYICDACLSESTGRSAECGYTFRD